MCTRALWTHRPHRTHPICGRNMDWGAEMNETLMVFPRGSKRISRSEVTGVRAEWKSKYGSVTVVAYGKAASDGMNEKGLAAHALWLSETDCGERNESRPGIDSDRALQYVLDNFATVQEVIDLYRAEKDPQIVAFDVEVPGQASRTAQCHLVIEDANGHSAIIEYIKGKASIYHSGDLAYADLCDAVTNSPTFDKQLEGLKQYKGFGGDKELPGSTESCARFVRAAHYLQSLPPDPKDQMQAIAGVLSVLRSCAQPFRKTPGEVYESSTRWRTAADLQDKLYMYESAMSPMLVWVKCGSVDFSEGAPVRIFDPGKHPQYLGDISELLDPAPVDPFQ